MPQASQGQRAGWWPSYSSVADTNVRPRATSAKWSPTRERRSFFGELEVPKAAKAHVGPSAALPKPQFSRKISWEEHRLSVSGMVDNPTVFTMDDLLAMPARELPITLVCAGNRRKGKS